MAVVDPYRFQKPFELGVETRGKTALLRLVGEFDLTGKMEFEAGLSKLAELKPIEVVVDLREVTYIDSTGLRLILEAWNHCRRRELDFAVLVADGRVRGLFEETGLDQALPIAEGIPIAEYGAAGPARGNGSSSK
jgi:anti-sigma B factor antagonist